MSSEKRKVIIDCDPGADDAQAIIIALSDPRISIVAITTVFGNTTVENTFLNVLRLLKFCGRTDIPVYKGCDCNLIMEPSQFGAHFGSDGFGDITIPGVDPVDISSTSTEHASVALCRLVSKYPGEVTLIALGSLTNVAVSLKLDPEFGSKLADCIIMGGNYHDKDTASPTVEFNFGKDPEAAHAVLEGLGTIQPLLLTFETCLQYSASWEWYEKYTTRGTELSNLMRDIDQSAVKNLKNQNFNTYLLCDQFAVCAALNPLVVEEVQEVYATVRLRGELSRGLVEIDWDRKQNRSANVRIVTRIDDSRCRDAMMRSVEMS